MEWDMPFIPFQIPEALSLKAMQKKLSRKREGKMNLSFIILDKNKKKNEKVYTSKKLLINFYFICNKQKS